MILADQMKEVKRLDQIRIKNEQAVPREVLQGRLRKSYEKLLNNLSNQNKMAVDYCRKVFDMATEYLERGMGVYDIEELAEMLRGYYEAMSDDPFAKKILTAVCEALEDRDMEDGGMVEVNNMVGQRTICRYCGKKAATQLCDMPKHTIIMGVKRSFVKTCDNPMCPDCATKFRGFELCPDCVEELRKTTSEETEYDKDCM